MLKLFLAFEAFSKRNGGADESDVGEGLREISESRAGARIDFFGKQTEIVRILQQMLKMLRSSLFGAAAEGEKLRFPETTDPERSLRRNRSISVDE